MSKQDYYAALVSRDRNFDGRFYVGVSSTRIYCRPVCRVRVPQEKNCHFYPTAAAAEREGYRPCMKCRPEAAPGLSPIDYRDHYIRQGVELIETGFLTDNSCDDLAARLGITGRHLRRLFAEQLGTSPIEYAQTSRLLSAKRLLTDTQMSLAEVAMAAGFSSVRRFNELFKSRYRMVPGQLRRQKALKAGQSAKTLKSTSEGSGEVDGMISFTLSYRPPYDWPWMLGFLARRAVSGLECCDGQSYQRSLRQQHGGKDYSGWVRVTPQADRAQLTVELSDSLVLVAPLVLQRVRKLLDLDSDPASQVDALGELAESRPGLRLPGAVSVFEIAVRAVAGQQVSVKAATTLVSRLVHAFGEPMSADADPLRYLFPLPEQIAIQDAAQLQALGFTRRRAECLVNLAVAVVDNPQLLILDADVDQAINALCELPGIGRWTATYIAMRGWGWPDAFLESDLVVRKACPGMSPKQLELYSRRWSPWRSYAVLQLWQKASELA